MRPASLETLYSAGGVIFRTDRNFTEVALISLRGGSVWSLPKGIIEGGESPEQTALREVSEETGLKGRMVSEIGENSYWFFVKDKNAKCKKTVKYFLLEYISGSTENHDGEVEEAAWFTLKEAACKVTHKGDRQILAMAEGLIEGLEK